VFAELVAPSDSKRTKSFFLALMRGVLTLRMTKAATARRKVIPVTGK
jgi:hypothetical protein